MEVTRMANRADRIQDDVSSAPSATLAAGPAAAASGGRQKPEEKVLPLPGWLMKLYFIFPIVLYVPDAIFNYYVYSDGAQMPGGNLVLQISQIALWAFLAVGIVGMAWLLSMLAPWHSAKGHHLKALFCWVGVIVATAITTWNSLAFRSTQFQDFKTDQLAYQVFPQLQEQHISLTMLLVAFAPPFWGLFWAIVQPTAAHKSVAELNMGHQERMIRLQQEAEIKRLKAETSATVRAAQLKGMAQTAAAAREQAGAAFASMRKKPGASEDDDLAQATGSDKRAQSAAGARQGATAAIATDTRPDNILQMPALTPARPRDLGRNTAMMNSAAPAAPVRTAPANGRVVPAQPPLLRAADVQGTAGVPSSDATNWGLRRSSTLNEALSPDVSQPDGMTGTTGPRPAVRRAADPSPLLRAMNELPPAYVRAVDEARAELNPTGAKKAIPAKDLIALVAKKLNVDEATASKIISRIRESQRATARS
jgi:hypothetical protein